MDDARALTVVKRCEEIVFAHLRWIQEQGQVQNGSEIEQDDAVFTVMSMRELVTAPIKAALDCLLLACWSLVRSEYVRGNGHPALVRSSLTSSTLALWILDDERLVRRTRALIVARTQCAAELEHIEQLAPGWRTSDVALGPAIARRTSRRDRVLADGQRLGLDAATIRRKPKDQRIVRDGGDRIPPDLLPGNAPGAYVLSEWRLLSSRAHGFHWAVKLASTGQPDPDDARFATYDATIPIDRFLGSIRVAMIAVRVAIDRFALLAGLDPPNITKPWVLS